MDLTKTVRQDGKLETPSVPAIETRRGSCCLEVIDQKTNQKF